MGGRGRPQQGLAPGCTAWPCSHVRHTTSLSKYVLPQHSEDRGRSPFFQLPRAIHAKQAAHPALHSGSCHMVPRDEAHLPQRVGRRTTEANSPTVFQTPSPLPPTHPLTLLPLRANEVWPCKQPRGPQAPPLFLCRGAVGRRSGPSLSPF